MDTIQTTTALSPAASSPTTATAVAPWSPAGISEAAKAASIVISPADAALIDVLTGGDGQHFDQELARVIRDGNLSTTQLGRDDHPCHVTAAPLAEVGIRPEWIGRTLWTCRALFDAMARQAKAAGDEARAKREGADAAAFLASQDRELARAAAQALAERTTCRAFVLAFKFHPIGWRALSRIDRSLSLDTIVSRALHAAVQAAGANARA